MTPSDMHTEAGTRGQVQGMGACELGVVFDALRFGFGFALQRVEGHRSIEPKKCNLFLSFLLLLFSAK